MLFLMNSNNLKKNGHPRRAAVLAYKICLPYLAHLQDAPQVQFSQVQTSQLQLALLHFG
jgi:hypothetical protein